jgi:hypothetical protein
MDKKMIRVAVVVVLTVEPVHSEPRQNVLSASLL